MYKLGVIGLGGRISSDGGVLWNFFQYCNEFCVTAIADPDSAGVKKKVQAHPAYYSQTLQIFDDADEMLDQADVDGILIGTRDNLHTEMAIKAMRKKVPIFLEKPISTTIEDALRLKEAMDTYHPKVLVSFPLRYSDITTEVKKIIDAGTIGEVLQVEAFDDVPYGRCFYHSWMRDESITGGLWTQKATHDFDLYNYILNDTPKAVYASEVRKLFKGDMPAGMKCEACSKTRTCPESPYTIEHVYHDEKTGPYCCFAKDTGNHDCGTAILNYKSGVLLSFSQNFFARFSAARRGARFYGYKGTLEFDFYKSEIKVYLHTSPRVDTYKYDEQKVTHFGGDLKLAELFLNMFSGTDTQSYLAEGLESVLTCLMAQRSCETGERITPEKLGYRR